MKKLALLLLLLPVHARAIRTIMEQTAASNNTIFIDTNTQGVGIGTNTAVGMQLNVEGNAQFGRGATKSTFTATGALNMASGAAINLTGAAGNVVSQASMTAAQFFGNGGALSGIPSTASIVGVYLPLAQTYLPEAMTVSTKNVTQGFNGNSQFAQVGTGGSLAPTVGVSSQNIVGGFNGAGNIVKLQSDGTLPPVTASSATLSSTLGVGVTGQQANGTAVIQSTSTTATTPALRVLANNGSTELLRVQQNAGVGISSAAVPAGVTLAVGGTINATGLQINNVAGQSATCAAGQALEGATYNSGVPTGGTCTAAGGGDVLSTASNNFNTAATNQTFGSSVTFTGSVYGPASASTFTYLNSTTFSGGTGAFGQQTVTGSTITYTSLGTAMCVSFSGGAASNANASGDLNQLTFLLDGAPPDGNALSFSTVNNSESAASQTFSENFFYRTKAAVSAAAHSLTLAIRAGSGTHVLNCNQASSRPCYFEAYDCK